MARIKMIQYKCDICSVTVNEEKDLEVTHIPCYGGERNEYHSECELDLCKECSANLRTIIYNQFASINDWYGIHVTNNQSKK